MAINFTNLFEDVGEFVDRVNEFAGFVTTIGTGLSEIEADLSSNGTYQILDGEEPRHTRYRQQILSWIDQTGGKIQERILDKDTVRDELTLGNVVDFAKVIEAFYAAMVTAGESITANVVSFGGVTATLVNSSSGAYAYLDKVLDGVNPPHTGYPVIASYVDEDSQLALTDSMSLVCIADSETDGLTEGQEQLQWSGKPTAGHNYHWLDYGSGTGPIITPIQAGGLMLNMEFQDFTSNLPDSWDLDAGTVVTHVDDDTSNFKRGDTSLKFTGDAAQASIQISQTNSSFTPLKRYVVGFWVQGTAGTSSGTLTIQFEGTGYTAGATEKITMNAAALAAATSFVFKQFFVNMPAQIPDDFALVIKWTGTPSAHSLYINGGGMQEAKYFNGHTLVVTAGSAPILRGDKFTYTVTNDYAGVFQTAFAKLLGFQLPTSGSPTQADSLAT